MDVYSQENFKEQNQLHSWRRFPIYQDIGYDDLAEFEACLEALRQKQVLIKNDESFYRLKSNLVSAARGDGFILQAGDCAERFEDANREHVFRRLGLLLALKSVLASSLKKPVTVIGRMAGQYGKPRSSLMEVRGTVAFGAYRGEMVNGFSFSKDSRRHDPKRLLIAYEKSKETLDYVAEACSSLSSAKEVKNCAEKFLEESVSLIPEAQKIRQEEGFEFESDLFVSHELLHLDYESTMFRNEGFDYSAHFLWLGERTRNLNGAHVEFISKIQNPIGIKLSSSFSEEEILNLFRKINPQNELGKVVFILRFGNQDIASNLPRLIKLTLKNALAVVWMSDPMHGNHELSQDNIKTRQFSKILEEVLAAREILEQYDQHLAGIHLEVTPDSVTECLGSGIHDLSLNYETYCDPRFNAFQAIELCKKI